MTTEQYSDILLDSVPEVTQVNYTYRQSANVLFNFMPKLYASFVKEEPFRENIKYTSIFI